MSLTLRPKYTVTINSFVTLKSLSNYLRTKTYHRNPSPEFESFFKLKTNKQDGGSQKIIEPVSVELLLADLNQLTGEHFLFSQGSYSVYCAPYDRIPNLILEIGRLREITFRGVGEGTNKSIDLDQYDRYYNHLIVWDNSKKQLAGAYRIGKGKEIIKQHGKNGFYINSLFKIKKGFYPFLQESLELGRSFIVKEYQRQPLSLVLLWKGIIYYLMKNAEYRYLIGPVSISNDFNNKSKSLIVQFLKRNYFDFTLSAYINPRKKFRIHRRQVQKNDILLDEIDNSIKTLDLYINELQSSKSLPVLLKKYLQLNGKIIGFNIDPDFNDCLDALMIVNIGDIPSLTLENIAKENDIEVKKRFQKIYLS